MIKWLPISGAPMDGTPTHKNSITVARYNTDRHSKNPRPYWNRSDTTSMRDNRRMWPTHYAVIPVKLLLSPKIESNFSDDTYQDRLDSEIREEYRNG